MIETVAFVSAFAAELERTVASKTLTEIDQVLMKHTFATKSERLSVAPEYKSVNVLTLIGKLDKTLFSDEGYGFLGCYDALSEMAHPNYFGTTMLFGTLHRKRFEQSFDLGKPLGFAAQHIVTALGAAEIAEMIFMARLDRAIADLSTFAP